ncbi:hypothetical protein CHS0354_008690 [Potamilus streckersoni]|uniref:Peptidase C51 domain-containing protein n=1 Tax=Potamilus streckersoni TaxID=2493646 RepID=A0AAE0TH96_9BIVA|nr:hypothetical protein CHS0354_008690 [Potamilus streckersoni]
MCQKKLVLSLFVAFCVNVVCQASSSGESIGNRALWYVGSEKWLYSGSHQTGANTNKCNIFVADILKEEGCPAPNRRRSYSPIGAYEWANSNSVFLGRSPCWERCNSPEKGDVIATDGHVGIVSGYQRTTSASAAAYPPGLIVENDWGFRSGQNPTCWRYRHYSGQC